MASRLIAPLAAAVFLASAGLAMAQTAADGDAAFRATTLSISAFGEVKAVPDKATITLGVQTSAPTAAQAMNDNAARMTAVVAALRKQGLGDRDIQTSNLNLSAHGAGAATATPAATATASHHPGHSARPSRRPSKAPG